MREEGGGSKRQAGGIRRGGVTFSDPVAVDSAAPDSPTMPLLYGTGGCCPLTIKSAKISLSIKKN